MTDGTPRVNLGYVLDQLERALAANRSHRAEAAREPDGRRADQWRRVLQGMLDHSLDIGSRVPVQGIPPWATLEVVQGGFATGSLLAGGPLRAHETVLLDRLDEPRSDAARAALNLHYLGDEGRRTLMEMLRSRRYRIQVPEEGALLVLAWLLAHGEAERAETLVDAITPFFDRLRFYPVPDPRPFVPGPVVKLQTIGETAAALETARPRVEIDRMAEALEIWAPLYDRAVALFLDTVDGPVPALKVAKCGTLARRSDGNPIVQGGWPCRHYPDRWRKEARTLLDDYRSMRARHSLCGKPERRKENFARLRAGLECCVHDPAGLTGRDVGMIRKVLASYVTRHGAPGSERLARLRAEQAETLARPTHKVLRNALVMRLREWPQDGGLESLDRIMAPVSADEAPRFGAPTGAAIPAHLSVKVGRCLEAPIDELVETGVIGAAEILARVLPQITSQIRSAGLSDPDLRALYAAIYAAFRRRRSLLLLDLEHQVRLEELPWIAAIEPLRRDDMDARSTARQALEQLAALALTHFPQTILPNTLIQEFRALADTAGLSLPFVDELAADIFVGHFSPKFLDAAKAAATMLDGSVYARYYGVPFERVLAIDDVVKRWKYAAPISPGFAALCAELARTDASGLSVAGNGMIIEQQQILTTHNLAVLFGALGLGEALRDSLPELAQRCFHWICRRQQMKISDWRARLQTAKNCAYAWRQMIFFLSLADGAELEAFMTAADDHLRRQGEDFQNRFGPAMRGLSIVAGGGAFDGDGWARGGARRFLGWSAERHWIL